MSKKILLTTASGLALIETVAKAHGTFASPHRDRPIIYVDPDHESEEHSRPLLTQAEAKEAFQRGLIEDPAGAKQASADPSDAPPLDPAGAPQVAARETEEFAEAEEADGTGQAPSPNLSRSSTAFPDNDRVTGDAHGRASGPSELEAGDGDDADAAPAPAATTRAPRGGKSS